MRRLARHLFALVSAVSLLLFVAVCVLWARSLRTTDGVASQHRDGTGVLLTTWVSKGGRLVARVAVERVIDERDAKTAWRSNYLVVHRGRRAERFFGTGYFEVGNPLGVAFDVSSRSYTAHAEDHPDTGLKSAASGGGGLFQEPEAIDEPGRSWAVSSQAVVVGLPHWLAAAALGIVPLLAARGRSKRRRAARAGLCRRCGYDLRASPGRCPECGAVAAPVKEYRVRSEGRTKG